jgi:hypothetical protein
MLDFYLNHHPLPLMVMAVIAPLLMKKVNATILDNQSTAVTMATTRSSASICLCASTPVALYGQFLDFS